MDGVSSTRDAFPNVISPHAAEKPAGPPVQPAGIAVPVALTVQEHLDAATALVASGRPDDAIPHFLAILEVERANAGIWNNLGLALVAAGHHAEAIQALRTAVSLAPESAEVHANLADRLRVAGELRPALGHFARAIELRPKWAQAWNNFGVTARALGRADDARAAFERAIALDPTSPDAHFNLGNAAEASGDAGGARDHFARALERLPGHADALFNLAGVSEEPDEAARLYAFAQMLDGDPRSCAPRTVAQLRGCDWDGLDPLIAATEAAVRNNTGRPTAPFQFLQISADPLLQRRCAERWTAERVLPRAAPWRGHIEPVATAPRSERLRIGYLSGDLRDHAMGRLLAGFLPCHDRERFQIVAYSSGPDDGSDVRARIASSVDRFIDVRFLDDGEFADCIRQDGIDVLVDLGGYTQHSRTEVLVHRPAPVQVSYLGYPGTLGAHFVDGVIVDPLVVPDHLRRCYTEPIVHLRSSMLATPAWESGEAQAGPARSHLGLPDEAVVLACFAAPLKWRPDVFEAWLRLLRGCPRAVLWLLDPGAEARSRLIERARAHGLDADRLVWAQRVAYEDHSRRLAAADLCLDTYPYGSGATAVQTLHAGVPLLALTGRTCVSRMAASLLVACELRGLITASLDEYEAQGRRLLADPAALPALRKALRSAIPTVFDARAHASALEECFTTMVRARS